MASKCEMLYVRSGLLSLVGIPFSKQPTSERQEQIFNIYVRVCVCVEHLLAQIYIESALFTDE